MHLTERPSVRAKKEYSNEVVKEQIEPKLGRKRKKAVMEQKVRCMSI